MGKLLLRAKLSYKLYSEVHMAIITWWFQLTKRSIDYKKKSFAISKLEMDTHWKKYIWNNTDDWKKISEDGNRLSFAWKFWDILTFQRKCLKATCACGSSEEMGLKENPLIPPPQALSPKLGSNPLELVYKQFLFPELFKSNRKYIRREHRCNEEWWQLYKLSIRWYVSRFTQTVAEMILRRAETYFLAPQGPDLEVV